MRRLFFVSFVSFVIFIVALTSRAQVQTATYSYGAFDNKGVDTINIGNLNALLSIPIFSKPGRGLPFNYNLAYNSSVWSPSTVSGTTSWTPSAYWGWTAQTDVIAGKATASEAVGGTCYTNYNTFMPFYVLYNFTYQDSMGGVHSFGNFHVNVGPTPNNYKCVSRYTYQSPFNSPPYTTYTTCPGPAWCNATTVDGSGYALRVFQTDHLPNLPMIAIAPITGGYSNPPLTLNSPSGSGPATVIDANGNQVSVSSTGQYTDTTGNVVLTVTYVSSTATTYQYTDTSGTTRTATLAYTAQTVQTNFGCSGIAEFGPVNTYLVSGITFADGTSYGFTYEPTPGVSGKVTGRLATITTPQGGRINYGYTGGSNGIVCADGGTATLTRSMPDDPLTPSVTYTRTPLYSGSNTSHTERVDGMANYAEYDFVDDPKDPNVTPFVINYKQYQGAATGTPLQWDQSCLNGATAPCAGQSLSLPIAHIVTTSTLNGTYEKISDIKVNNSGLVTDDSESDYGLGAPGPDLSWTSTSYASLTNGIVDRPSTVWTCAGNIVCFAVSMVSYGYDENTLTSTSSLPQHSSVSGSRGNLTSVAYGAPWDTTPLTTSEYWYDDAGQMRTSKDAALNQTTYTYDSGTDTFLSGVTYPSTGGVSHSTNSTWDVVRGVKTQDSDLNGNLTNYTYDLMLRPYTISGPGGFSQTYSYALGSATPHVSVATLHQTGGSSITATTYLDSYARQTKMDTTDAPSDDLIVYSYDANGNVNSVSNPYRSGGTINYTTTSFDALGRPYVITDSDGASQYGATYSGNSVLLTDEAGNQRKIFTDGLGRISKVLEPDNTGSLTLETDYLYWSPTGPGAYQTIINQKGGSSSSSDWRTRKFTYDWFGRIIGESTPEAGSLSFTYPNGAGSCAGVVTLACTRTDANGTSTTYSYDALNRITGKSYGGSSIGTGTSSISYYYDQTSYNALTISNGNGQRTGMSDGSGNTAWSFDGMGRVATLSKTVSGVTKQAGYTYNADGSANTFQDYGGTTFTYGYDISGRPTSVVDGSSKTYASSAVYNAAGELTSLNHQLTSEGGAYVRSIQYNNLLQPAVISATLNGSTIQSLTYGYYQTGSSSDNNGNVLAIANGMDSSRSQTYTYDYMNRLASGRDSAHWGETYTYDNWGNLYQTQQISGLSGNNWSVTPTVQNRLSNLTYDLGGEVTQDQYSNIFSYDAEGRVLTGGSGTYVYDGDGNRVKKLAGTATTLYWPGTTGVLNESDGSGLTMGKQVQFAGLLVWHEDTSGSGNFLFHDQLGSVRLTASASGSVADDTDYLPFGTLYNNYGVSPSDNHYLFTGDESDATENSTDYAVNRNLSFSMGRFNRPDPYDGSYDISNPQSLNRYSYVLNNPLALVDPSGLDYCTDVKGNRQDNWSYQTCANEGGIWTYTVTVHPPPEPVDPISLIPPAPDPGNPIGGGVGGIGSSSTGQNNGTPWYQNSCVTGALASNAANLAIDAAGAVIPGVKTFGTVGRLIGAERGYATIGRAYQGIVADQAGAKAITSLASSANAGAGLASLTNTSALGLASTALTAVGLFTPFGQIASVASLGIDAYKTYKAVSACYPHP